MTGPSGPAGAVGGGVGELLVVGAHMRGGCLNIELTGRGGRFVADVCTADCYRLYALATEPPKPGLVRVKPGAAGAGRVAGELWQLPPAGLASLLHELPRPMALGRVQLENGAEVVGFLCEPAALQDAREITEYGGWRAYLSVAD
jgi:allophanate hydrolase